MQGYECDAPIVAQVLGTDPAAVEERLETLERIHGFVRRLREHQFPDGTPAVRYCFVHVLYQNGLYARLTPTRRAELSRTVAEALLGHYRERSAKVAAEVTFLIEAARDVARAVEYFAAAAERAAQVHAHGEAVALAKRGLALLDSLPDTLERTSRELALQLRLAFSVQVTAGYVGYADPAVGARMALAHAICHQLGDSPHLFAAVYGLWLFYLNTGQIPATRESAEQIVRIAEPAGDPALLLGAHAAQEHLDRTFTLYDQAQGTATVRSTA